MVIKNVSSIFGKKEEAERLFDEKWTSICRVVEDYYKRTYKDVNRYAVRLPRLDAKLLMKYVLLVIHLLEWIEHISIELII